MERFRALKKSWMIQATVIFALMWKLLVRLLHHAVIQSSALNVLQSGLKAIMDIKKISAVHFVELHLLQMI